MGSLGESMGEPGGIPCLGRLPRQGTHALGGRCAVRSSRPLLGRLSGEGA